MSPPPTREDRVKCYNARDTYWKCLDSNELISDPKSKIDCEQLRKTFTENCPQVWVFHFDRKYKYEKFKAEQAKENAKQMAS
ncbi:cytochrome c oxidase assembly factor 6 homolog [Tetranychus urticae]|uniref:cytochrome c oxidase assembly factor 6 homolog n=1 Tax=Tetranychus urticae TaxID=32264 RepID=UPI0003564165|nr:cytochrome c oxidase assembly factor 6 homolog [Tetranychus urticae]